MIKTVLKNPLISLGLIMLASLCALSAAFIAEKIFGLEPCNLCIYQRYPFALGIILGGLGIALYKNKTIARALLALCGLNFLVNSAIAFYHTGVEQKWWESALEGCTVPIFKENGKTLLENLMGTPVGSCSVIPWQDPLLNLSMANYNIIFCFGLFLFCALSYICVKK